MKLLVAALLTLLSSADAAILCTPGICSGMPCPLIRETDCDGRVDPKGGFCGCCPSCIKQIGEGEQCLSLLPLLGVPQNSECETGLFCNRTTRVCEKKPCSMQLAEVKGRLDAAKQSGKHLVGVPVPRCNSDGTFSAVQCSGSVCYCVNKKGETLFSDKPNNVKFSANVWEQADMNCRCAVDQHEYMQKGLIGKMFSCERNGNYAKVGCTGSVCYCTDENGKQVGTASVNIGQQDSLNC